MDFNKKTVLITGAAGFVGSNLALHLQEHFPKCHIVAFDIFRNYEAWENGNIKSYGHFKNLIGFRGDVVAGDICKVQDLKRLEETYKFDVILHQAAISDTTMLDQEVMIRVNVNAFRDLLDLAKKQNAVMVYASSASTYGNSPAPNRVGVGEVPENVYGFSKFAMDNLALSYSEQHGVTTVGLRYFNIFGLGEFYKNKTSSMILQLSLQLLEGKNPTLFKYGEQKRDFVYIKDVVQANVKAAGALKTAIYNVGFGRARMFKEIVEILQVHLKTDLDINFIDNPYSFYQNHTEADIEPTKIGLGYVPQFDLETGIADYINQIRNIHAGMI